MNILNTLDWKPSDWLNQHFKIFSVSAKAPAKLTLIFIIVNLFFTIPLALKLNIWFDEAYTLNTTSRDLGYAIRQAIHFEEQAPFYFAILTLWRQLNSSIFFARLFSVLCVSLTIYISTLISKRLFSNIHPGWVAIALAINPFMIWAAVEIRLFAFSILLSAIALLFFLDGYWIESPKTTARWLHAGTAVVALYTHYFLAFSFIAYGAALLCFRKQRFFNYCCNMLLAGASLIPLFIYLMSAQQVSAWTDNPITTSSYTFSLVDSLRTSFAAPLLYLLPARIGDYSPSSWRLLRFLFLGVLLIVGFTCRRSITTNVQAIWSITLTICIIFLIVFELFNFLGLSNSIQYFRHTISLLIPTVFSVLAVFSLIKGKQQRMKILGLWLGFMFVLNFTSIYFTFSPLAKHGDYVRVASFLMENELADQPILVFNPEVEMALSHYYRGVNQLIALPKEEEFVTYDLNALILKDEQEIFEALPQVRDYAELWLVVDTDSMKPNPDYSNSYKILENFIAKNYSIVTDQDFYGSNVKRLKTNPN